MCKPIIMYSTILARTRIWLFKINRQFCIWISTKQIGLKTACKLSNSGNKLFFAPLNNWFYRKWLIMNWSMVVWIITRKIVFPRIKKFSKEWMDNWTQIYGATICHLLRDHSFKTSACLRGGGVKNWPNLPTDSSKKLPTEGG